MAGGKGRDGRREARWRRIVRQHRRSGLSVREFCRRGKFTETAFYFWRRELQRRQAEQQQCSPADPPTAPAFVAVRVEERSAPAAGGQIQILLSGGCRVQVTAPVDRQALADVLAVLAAAAPAGEGRPC
jgi:transposase-like protein